MKKLIESPCIKFRAVQLISVSIRSLFACVWTGFVPCGTKVDCWDCVSDVDLALYKVSM
jgi:hypothetical protein